MNRKQSSCSGLAADEILCKQYRLYKSRLNCTLCFVSLGIVGGGLKSQQCLYLTIKDVKKHLLAQQQQQHVGK